MDAWTMLATKSRHHELSTTGLVDADDDAEEEQDGVGAADADDGCDRRVGGDEMTENDDDDDEATLLSVLSQVRQAYNLVYQNMHTSPESEFLRRLRLYAVGSSDNILAPHGGTPSRSSKRHPASDGDDDVIDAAAIGQIRSTRQSVLPITSSPATMTTVTSSVSSVVRLPTSFSRTSCSSQGACTFRNKSKHSPSTEPAPVRVRAPLVRSRSVSFPPFLRPIEEEETGVGDDCGFDSAQPTISRSCKSLTTAPDTLSDDFGHSIYRSINDQPPVNTSLATSYIDDDVFIDTDDRCRCDVNLTSRGDCSASLKAAAHNNNNHHHSSLPNIDTQTPDPETTTRALARTNENVERRTPPTDDNEATATTSNGIAPSGINGHILGDVAHQSSSVSGRASEGESKPEMTSCKIGDVDLRSSADVRNGSVTSGAVAIGGLVAPPAADHGGSMFDLLDRPREFYVVSTFVLTFVACLARLSPSCLVLVVALLAVVSCRFVVQN